MLIKMVTIRSVGRNTKTQFHLMTMVHILCCKIYYYCASAIELDCTVKVNLHNKVTSISCLFQRDSTIIEILYLTESITDPVHVQSALCTVLYCTVLYCTVPYCTVLYHFIVAVL